jgi:glycosyltransferase involved in cell wall biosynthesis
MSSIAATPTTGLKVAHVAWLSEVGGGELFLLDLLGHVDATRFPQAIYCLGPGGRVPERMATLGHPVHRFPRTGRLGLGMMLRLAGALRRARPDVVQTHGEAGIFWGVPAARFAGCRAVAALLYQNHPGASHKMWALRLGLRSASVVVAGSADVQRFLVAELGVAPARALVIPCAIDAETFLGAARKRTHDAEARRRPVIVTVGRLVREKGHAVLLRAFARLRPRCDAELWIVGDGLLRDQLAGLAEELGIGEHVRFLGTVCPTVDVLNRADVFAFPSLVEPQGLAILEAFAAGVPVVASRTGGIVEMLEDGRDGLLVAPGDPEALALALAKLLDDPLLRDDLASGGRRRLAEFDIHLAACRYQELWTSLAAGATPGGRARRPDMIAT